MNRHDLAVYVPMVTYIRKATVWSSAGRRYTTVWLARGVWGSCVLDLMGYTYWSAVAKAWARATIWRLKHWSWYW